jgi:hypothetical protein
MLNRRSLLRRFRSLPGAFESKRALSVEIRSVRSGRPFSVVLTVLVRLELHREMSESVCNEWGVGIRAVQTSIPFWRLDSIRKKKTWEKTQPFVVCRPCRQALCM